MFDKLIELIVNCIKIFFFLTTVREYEQSIVLRFGKFHRTLQAGTHFIWPFYIEEVLTAIVVLETINVGPQSLMTKDGFPLVVSSVVSYQVVDAKKFLLKVYEAKNVIEDSLFCVVSEIITQTSKADLSCHAIEEEIYKKIRVMAMQWGIKIIRYAFSDFCSARSFRILGKVDPVMHHKEVTNY